MEVGVRLVLELASEEPAVGVRQLHGLGHHPGAAGRRRGEHDLGAEEAHQLPALHAEGFRHGDDQRVPLLRAHHRQADAGVAAGGFHHGLAGLEGTATLGILDHAERQAILDRAERIEGFDLDVEVDALGRELGDLDHRRVADGLEDVGEFCHVVTPRERVVANRG